MASLDIKRAVLIAIACSASGSAAAQLSATSAVTTSVSTAAAPDTTAFHLEEATIENIQRALRANEITVERLVERYLARIKAYNGTCVKQPYGILGPVIPMADAGQINALQTLNLRPAALAAWGFDARKARTMTDDLDDDPAMPDALETARALDARFAATGELVGPLHGVVLAVKDQYDTVDMRTTSGADTFYANDRPPDDATFIKRLRDAGAIILAKANLGEFASGIPRSAFGGTFCNPYDTERTPGGSSSGSGSAVAANLVTCAIAEETGSSIRGPAYSNSSVGISPTQELVSRDGMIQQGINTRVGPICRTVADAARILDVIAGYDPKDELTAFSVGRMPSEPYAHFAEAGRLDGLRIGVVREYMDKSAFTAEDEQAIDLVEAAAAEIGKLGATMVDPGAGGALLDDCTRRYMPMLHDKHFTREHPALFPVGEDGKPAADHIAALIDLAADPAPIAADLRFRTLGGVDTPGQSRYWLDRYLRERGDANIKSTADVLTKAAYYSDPSFPDHRERHARAVQDLELDMAARMQNRFAIQTMVLQCMAEMELDALVYPTSNHPPAKLGAPRGPDLDGRPGDGIWRFLGRNGFPVITVPAGFTSEVYDRVRSAPAAAAAMGLAAAAAAPGAAAAEAAATEIVGPIPAELPIGIDIVARPFGEPTLLRVAAAFEAATRHRRPPQGFGALDGEP